MRRFPSALWARIKHDLFEYMVEKEADDTRVIYWYHRRFIEVSNDVYVSNLGEIDRELVFSNVIDFFNETWKDKPKPFKHNQRIVKKKHLTTEQDEASRNTATQETAYVDEDGLIRYNKRKITELPGFIAQMTQNISIPLATKHIFFNYEFTHGMFACCSFTEIFDQLEKFSNGSSYSIGDEASSAFKELKFLNFYYLQSLISMSDYADSVAVQMLSRGLIFYGFLPHLTEFIKQADSQSKHYCALIAPYQSLPPPGIGPLFKMEQHTKPITCSVFGDTIPLVFTLSDKIHGLNLSQIKNLGEIILPKLTAPDIYKQMLIYLIDNPGDAINSLKLMNGSAIVTSTHVLYSISLDSSRSFMKVFENIKIRTIFQISPNHILVFFDEQKYFEIYDFNTGQIVFVKNFDIRIKFIETEKVFHESNVITVASNFEPLIMAIVVLDDSSIEILILDTKEGVSIKQTKSMAPSGIECVDIQSIFNGHENNSVILFSFKDGSVLIVDKNTTDGSFLKPLNKSINSNKSQDTLKYLNNYREAYLFLDDDKIVYMMSYKSREFILIKIGGTYNMAKFIANANIACVNKEIIDIYSVSFKEEKKIYKAIKTVSIDAHYMDITSLYYKGNYLNINLDLRLDNQRLYSIDQLIFTTSNDSVLKAFHLNSVYSCARYNFKLIRSENDIKFLFQINHVFFATYSNDLP